MGFEYDKSKSAANKRKHGIDFEEAQLIWDDLDALILPALACEETRHLVIGMIDRKCFTAIVTHRAENIRLISVRRARVKEAEFYEKNKSFNA